MIFFLFFFNLKCCSFFLEGGGGGTGERKGRAHPAPHSLCARVYAQGR